MRQSGDILITDFSNKPPFDYRDARARQMANPPQVINTRPAIRNGVPFGASFDGQVKIYSIGIAQGAWLGSIPEDRTQSRAQAE